MFQSIPLKRKLLYLMLAGIIPVVIAWLSFSSTLERVRAVEWRIWSIQEQALNREKKQSANVSVLNHFAQADHFYIDKNLETMSFLEPELESLRKMQGDPNFPDDENIKKRIDTLTGNSNNMVFTEGVVQSTPLFQEVTETLVHPVEIDVGDLKRILCRVEGIPIGDCTPPPDRPQLLILDFKMERKNISEDNDVFLLNLKLLKREFL
jgi:hypothetical protein